jgi:preprotein translocase subunit YajC
MFQNFTLLMGQPSQDGGPGLMANLVLFGSIILIFYFMIIRPQQKRAKEREKMISGIKKGDQVLTTGGIYGEVVGIDEKYVLVEIASNVKVKLDKGSVTITTPKAEPEKK